MEVDKYGLQAESKEKEHSGCASCDVGRGLVRRNDLHASAALLR
jgi:hypothetical protein